MFKYVRAKKEKKCYFKWIYKKSNKKCCQSIQSQKVFSCNGQKGIKYQQ